MTCGICNGIHRSDVACHNCGAIKIGGKYYNPMTFKEVVRGLPTIRDRAQSLLNGCKVSIASQNAMVARLVR